MAKKKEKTGRHDAGGFRLVEPAARIEEQEREGEREQGRWPLDHKSISCQLNSECFACSSVCSLQACGKAELGRSEQ